MDFKNQKILFISVSFFSYEKAIAKRLKELGAEVDFFDDRPSNTILTRGIVRFNKLLLKRKITAYYKAVLKNIKSKKYDFFLLIKGEAIPDFFMEQLKKLNPEIQMICYTYDSFEEHSRFGEILKYFDKKFTFDRNDANRYGMNFRPLFFIHEYSVPISEKQVPEYDVVFVGSAHTDRYTIGEKVKNICKKKNLKTFFYYYSPGKSAYYLKKIFDKNFKTFNIKNLSFNKLSHQEIIHLYQKSKSVLDINKPYQNGLTMRTFEVLANGRKLITTNPDIVNYPFYNTHNILLIDRENPEIHSDFFLTDFVPMSKEALYYMSLDSWLECLFEKNQDYYWNF